MDTRDKQLKDELHYTLSRGSVSNDRKIQTILNHVTGELNIGCYEEKGELTSTQPRRRIRQFPNTLPRDKMTYIAQKTFKKVWIATQLSIFPMEMGCIWTQGLTKWKFSP